jgi:predicted ATPase
VHLIESIEVEGFWDTHSFEFEVFPDVTFLIGPNGTGKTTLINLIAAALTADFRTLDRVPFHKLVIKLTPEGPKRHAPRITIQKAKKKNRPFDGIDYRIRLGDTEGAEVRLSLEDAEEQLLLRRFPTERHMHDYYRHMSTGVTKSLRELVTVTWLSVHRTPIDRGREERSFESAVDQKLESQSNDIVRYFATLSGQKDLQVREFQESIFLSLLDQYRNESYVDYSRLSKLEEYEKSLIDIFKELHVVDTVFQKSLSSYVSRARQIKSPKRGSSSRRVTVPIDDAMILAGLARIDAVVGRWKQLQLRLREIFSQRDKFLSIVNELLQRKEMKIAESNELQFESRSGKALSAQMLSSGEKQLLILLSETLLQRERPAIFIADEPELSLHVLWQERLVASLRMLNPRAQIIAATHSPDIVGALASQAIDMESLIP